MDNRIPKKITDIVSSMLRSEEIDRAWNTFNASRPHENPKNEMADEIEGLAEAEINYEEQREILSFMRGFVEHQKRALGKTSLRETFGSMQNMLGSIPELNMQRSERRKQLDLLAGTLRDILPDDQRTDDEELSEPKRDLLRAMGKYTVQRVKLWVDFKEKSAHVWHDLKDIYKKQRIATIATAGIVLPLSAVLLFEGSVTAVNTKLEIQETGATNISADNVFGGQDFDPEIQKKYYDPNFKSCHDNLKTTFPTIVGTLENNGYKIPNWPHCIAVNNIGFLAQEGVMDLADGASYAYFSLMNALFNERLEEASNYSEVVAASYTMNGINKVNQPIQGGLNWANRGENLLHIPLLFTFLMYGFMKMLQAQKRSPEEWEEFKNDWIDWSTTAIKARPLVYTAPIASILTYLQTHGYDSNSGSLVDSNLVVCLLGGVLAGYAAHRVYASLGARQNYAMKTTNSADISLESFQTTSLPLSEQYRHEAKGLIGKKIRKALAFGAPVATSAAIVASDFSGFINNLSDGPLKDMAINIAEINGMILLAVPLVASSLGYNFIIDDPAQHSLFIGGGLTIGSAAGLVALGALATLKYGAETAKKFKQELFASALAVGLITSQADINNINLMEEALLLQRHEEVEIQPHLDAIPT